MPIYTLHTDENGLEAFNFINSITLLHSQTFQTERAEVRVEVVIAPRFNGNQSRYAVSVERHVGFLLYSNPQQADYITGRNRFSALCWSKWNEKDNRVPHCTNRFPRLSSAVGSVLYKNCPFTAIDPVNLPSEIGVWVWKKRSKLHGKDYNPVKRRSSGLCCFFFTTAASERRAASAISVVRGIIRLQLQSLKITCAFILLWPYTTCAIYLDKSSMKLLTK